MIVEISKITGISVEDITGNGRPAYICDARHLYWKILRDNGFTLVNIGRLSDRTHATILKGIESIEGLLKFDKKVQGWYEMAKNIKR